MYAWLWSKLPGPTWVRAVIALLLFAVIVVGLFAWVFPWLSHVLGFDDSTVSMIALDLFGGGS